MEAKEDLDEVAFAEAWAAELAERSSADDHFYGAWNSGSGGRGVPTSSAAQYAAASAAATKTEDSLALRRRAFEEAKQQAYHDIGDLPYERYIALDAKGHRIYDQTQKDNQSVQINYLNTLPDVDHNEFHSRDDIVWDIHNHPGNVAGFEGYDIPFSPVDLNAVYKQPNIREMQIISPQSIWSMKPGPNGWGDYDKFYEQVWTKYDLGDEVYQMSKEQVEGKLNAFWTNVSKEMGWTFTRTPRGQQGLGL